MTNTDAEIKLSAFNSFLKFWRENPLKVVALFFLLFFIALSAILVAGAVLFVFVWFFIIHPEWAIKLLGISV